MDELKKVYLYRKEEETKPMINDNDLQIQMTEGEEIRKGFDFKSIYHQYLHDDDALTFEETAEPKKTLRELDGAYASLREIHDQLSEVYHELIHAQSRE